ncbi:hypothetical protein [Solidesulfovibrio fructosivorans]|uniref:hypothetical protein n=1 Tax=Solidesulfovibrio fructosivorans TaxID=878 RepID=UPI00117D4DEC|nr:hypothetical protein [Solidesulfovibrio fructosivorans]
MNKPPSFWKWLFCKNGERRAGIQVFVDRWLILHVLVGLLASLFLDNCIVDSAKNIIIPFVGILAGITFAWSGNITALLTTAELDELSKYHQEGITGYVFSVQRAILVILVALILWVLVGLSVISNFFWRFVIFSVSSIAIRESWGVIMFAQMLTIYRERVAKAIKEKNLKSKKSDS